jgi:hypothetical protein
MTRAIAPPKGLNRAGKALWRAISGQWAGDQLVPDARERRILADVCAEADVLAALEVELAAAVDEGRLTVKGSQGQPVTHPHVAECRRSRAHITAGLLKLGFEDPAAAGSTGLKMSVAEAGRRGGQARRYGAGSAYGGGA